jgi:hypothetical protein
VVSEACRTEGEVGRGEVELGSWLEWWELDWVGGVRRRA